MSLVQRCRVGCHVCRLSLFFSNCVFPPTAFRLSSLLSLDSELVTKINSPPSCSPKQMSRDYPRPSGPVERLCALCFVFFFCVLFARACLAGKMSCIFSAGCAEMLNGRTRCRAHASERRRSSCSDSRLMRHRARPPAPLRLSTAELELEEQAPRIAASG